jgi:hypothetical protein
VLARTERSEVRASTRRGESRIDADIADFKLAIGDAYERTAGGPPEERPKAAFSFVIDQTHPPESRWLGKLRFNEDGSVLPTIVVTHLSSAKIAKDFTKAFFDVKRPLRQVQLDPLGTAVVGGVRRPYKRFIWITWATPLSDLPDNPTIIKREMGLDHYGAGEYVYRCFIEIDKGVHTIFVPTCLDAGLSPAWRPPPQERDVPWGLTRDLVTGDQPRPQSKKTAVPSNIPNLQQY